MRILETMKLRVVMANAMPSGVSEQTRGAGADAENMFLVGLHQFYADAGSDVALVAALRRDVRMALPRMRASHARGK
ncbi:MAG: hypothetical protein ABWY18_00430 [Tardiphaga sp.]